MPRFAAFQQATLGKRETQLRALANNAMDAIEGVLEEVANNIVEDLISNYDTAIPGETYNRSGNLGDSWEVGSVERHGDEMSIEITNNANENGAEAKGANRKSYGRDYAALVQGDEQTFRHEGAGWRTIKDISVEHSHEQGNKVRAAIRRAGNA